MRSRYASGRTTGLVLDSGDGVTHAVPVYEGFAMTNAIRRIDVAGRFALLLIDTLERTQSNHRVCAFRDVTDYLRVLLRKAGYSFQTSAEREIVRMIKEKMSYIAFNPPKEEKDASTRSEEFLLPDGTSIKVRIVVISGAGHSFSQSLLNVLHLDRS